jgi:hypothetical protein
MFDIFTRFRAVEQAGSASFSNFFTVAALCERRFRRSQTAATIKLIHCQQAGSLRRMKNAKLKIKNSKWPARAEPPPVFSFFIFHF